MNFGLFENLEHFVQIRQHSPQFNSDMFHLRDGGTNGVPRSRWLRTVFFRHSHRGIFPSFRGPRLRTGGRRCRLRTLG